MADFTEEARQAIIHTKPDCVIFFSTVGCRHGGGSEKISKDMVEREFGIPWITIDVDVLDKRFITKEKIATVGGVLRDCREKQAIPSEEESEMRNQPAIQKEEEINMNQPI